ncbi:MAG: alpha/beta hydrolase [Thaumarchaeota archaeon]|nr:alpha/beta hydrolase [Nitrososphaerota archaeon]
MAETFDNKSLTLEGGITIGLRDEGSSDVVMVLLHGLDAHSGSWRRTVPYFVGKIRVIAPSLPPTFVLGERLPVSRYVSFVEELFSKLKITTAQVVGHSMGGWVALRFALRNPELVGSLVLEDTAGVSTNGNLVGGKVGKDELARISARTLVVWGKEDVLFPLSIAYSVHRAINGSVLAIVEGAGHVPHWEQPEQFNRVVEKFLMLK